MKNVLTTIFAFVISIAPGMAIADEDKGIWLHCSGFAETTEHGRYPLTINILIAKDGSWLSRGSLGKIPKHVSIVDDHGVWKYVESYTSYKKQSRFGPSTMFYQTETTYYSSNGHTEIKAKMHCFPIENPFRD